MEEISQNFRVTSYQEVSEELGRKLLKLYGLKIFPRQGKIFADMLFEAGAEAGAYLSALSDIDEKYVKTEMAQNAVVKLKKLAYYLNLMKTAGYYTPVQVVDLENYLKGLLPAVKEVLIVAYSQIYGEDARVIVGRPQTRPSPADYRTGPAPMGVPPVQGRPVAPNGAPVSRPVPAPAEAVKPAPAEAAQPVPADAAQPVPVEAPKPVPALAESNPVAAEIEDGEDGD